MFFIKQKTADVLRISDWNSDVCSSDLITVQVGVFGAGGRMGSTVCAAVAADRECELVAAVDPHHEGIDLHLVARGADLPALTVAGDAEEFERAEVDVVVDFTHRSEEHTSELQSLMRISYAVFCLKKKKNKSNT